ncbi:aminotransferase class I/II-fold pyridoxal phosphate-dependent enzyme [Candidatus Roizmanbacteria bacterium]|nr:aminotransferase class I/II-fold pyridoxal phosphate-dependent enzyme [Candidatus Roizmanbacteria bacterium]
MRHQQNIDLQGTIIQEPLPDFVYRDIEQYLKKSNDYHSQPPELIEWLINKHGYTAEHYFLTAGEDEAILLLAQLYGKQTVVFTPTYSMYSCVTQFGGALGLEPSLEDGVFTIVPKPYPNATLIFLSNPNNPVGSTSRESIIELIENNPQAMVVIDEAFGEFLGETVADLIKEYANLVVLHSFSKSYGMAGIRIGYAMAQPQIITCLSEKSQYANISYLSVGAAISALKHEQYFARIRGDIVKRQLEFASLLRRQGFTVISSFMNTVLIKFDTIPEKERFTNFLLEHSIAIQKGEDGSLLGLDPLFVRISIGSKEQMENVESIIPQFIL